MFGRLFSIIAGIILINSFYLPWYKFQGINEISPLDVLNYLLSQPFNNDSIVKILSVLGILVLGALMILSSIFPNILLSILKITLAIILTIIHVTYFYSIISASSSPLDWLNILNTSIGFVMFMIAMIIYLFVVLFAIILSPVKGVGKLVGL